MDNINFNRLRELYYGTNTFNVDSVRGLYSAAKQTRQANQTKYTEKQVKEFLRKQETYQVDLAFKKPKKKSTQSRSRRLGVVYKRTLFFFNVVLAVRSSHRARPA